MSTSDAGLLERWIHGRDASAFSELVARHAELVFNVGRRVLRNDADAEDVAQDCFLKLANLQTPPRSSLGSWLHSVATRGAVDALRSSRYRQRREQRFAETQARRRATRAALEELESAVDECVTELPGELRDVVVAHFFHRRSHRDIAGQLGVSRQTVTHRIALGVERVRRRLERRGVKTALGALTTCLGGLAIEAAPPTLIASMGRVALAGPASTAGAGSATSALSVLLGGSLMNGKLVFGGIVAAILILVALFSTRRLLDDSTAPALEHPGSQDGPSAVAGHVPDESTAPPKPQGVVAVSAPVEHTGVVIDTSGAGVPGATVVIRSKALAESSGITVTSGESGRFQLAAAEGSGATLRMAPVTIHAFKRDVGAGFSHRQPAAPGQLEVTLVPFARIAGRVHDADTGQGIGGLRLTLPAVGVTDERARVLHRETAELFDAVQGVGEVITTDEDGRFAVEGILPVRLAGGAAAAQPFLRRIWFDSSATDYLVPGTRGGGPVLDLELRPGSAVDDVDIPLELGGSISGTVLGPADRSIAGASVRLLTFFATQYERKATANEEGRFRFGGLADDETYVVRATHPGLATGESRLVAMSTLEAVDDVDVHLGAGHRMSGRFVDDADKPVSSLTIGLRRRVRSRFVQVDQAVSDDDGRFAFTDVGPGDYFLAFTSPDHEIKTAPHFIMPADRDLLDQVYVLLPRSHRVGFITGQVVDPLGRPLPDLVVQAVWKSVLGKSTSGEDGTFRIDGLLERRSFTLTTAPGEFWSHGIEGVVTGSTGIVLVARRHGRLHGVVVDAETGAPLSDYRLRVVWPRPETSGFHAAAHRGHRDPADWQWTRVNEPGGRFLLEKVKSGERYVEVRAAGYAPFRSPLLAVSPGADSRALRVELERGEGRVVSGVVIDATSRQPIPGVRVRAHQFEFFYETLLGERRTTRPDRGIWETRLTDSRGRFEIGGLLPESVFHVAAWKDGYGVAAVSDVSASELRGDLVIELDAAASIRAACSFEPEGEKYFFYVQHRSGEPVPFTTYRRLERPGVVELPGLPPGRHRLSIFVRREQPFGPMSLVGDVHLDLDAGETRELSLDLPDFAARFGSVRGVVLGVAAPRRCYLTIVSASDRTEHYTHRQWQCAADGSFHLTGLRPGGYVIRAVDSSIQPPGTTELHVQLGERAHLTTELRFE